MTGSSLLDALSPALRAQVEASLGTALPAKSTTPSSSPAAPSPALGTAFSKAEVDALVGSQGYVVRKSLLGPAEAAAIHASCVDLRASSALRAAQVGIAGDATATVTSARGDQLLWLPQDTTALPPPVQRLLKLVEKLVHGLTKKAPSLGIRNIRSTQFAVFPGNGSRFVTHVDTHAKTAPCRRITCLYYLNPGWEPAHGGALRIHAATGAIDVPPLLDTCLFFRSFDVPHEVLPSFADRLAFTIWYYGDPEPILALPPALPCPENADEDATIFVSIASYRDSECAATLAELFATAKIPGRVHVGLCHQVVDGDDIAFLDSLPPTVRVHRMDAAAATGPCLARHLAQQLYEGETYYLQIDSHMRFRRSWDAFLIHELHRCPSPAPVLTTYPLGYTLPNKIPDDVRPTLLCAVSEVPADGLVRQCGKVLKRQTAAPLPSRFWAAGFAFAHGRVVTEVPYDPALSFVFFGEELSMAARLFTNGFDFFAPSEAVVYHLWSRGHRPSFREHAPPQEPAATDYVRRLVRGLPISQDERLRYRGLGSLRSLAAFHENVGLDPATGEVSWSSLWGGRDPIEFALDAAVAQ
ncbi:hypothetical protein ACHHYP_01617 [Achlya hypogyna]|uniref:procollagen-lysine 5-dioxygenase n=1 Tax=Achlya hypogyna TaxID=1202772 RepID=A0A1V9Z869_ACHHY|nr:hypothetical protein ACHHYP_01617 [Achlya hypogyna]